MNNKKQKYVFDFLVHVLQSETQQAIPVNFSQMLVLRRSQNAPIITVRLIKYDSFKDLKYLPQNPLKFIEIIIMKNIVYLNFAKKLFLKKMINNFGHYIRNPRQIKNLFMYKQLIITLQYQHKI